MERALLVVAVVAGGAGALLLARLARWVRVVARFGRARRKEGEAARILEHAGYAIVAEQVTAPCALTYEGEPVRASVRADYLVRRRGRLWVAEAKSGEKATYPADRATRRQLLEYAVNYDVAGVLLVDTEAGTVGRVEFPGLRPRGGPGFRAGLVVGLVAGLVLASVVLVR